VRAHPHVALDYVFGMDSRAIPMIRTAAISRRGFMEC